MTRPVPAGDEREQPDTEALYRENEDAMSDLDAALRRNDGIDALQRSIASVADPIRDAAEVLRNLEECGYTLRFTTAEERREKNDRGMS